MRGYMRLGLVIGLAVLVAACATQPMPDALDVPGFWSGLLHGVTSPFSLIGGLFLDIRIYAFPNSGWWYDCGFMLGLGALGGLTTAG